MWPDRVSKLGPLALESDVLPTALRGSTFRPLLSVVQHFSVDFFSGSAKPIVTQLRLMPPGVAQMEVGLNVLGLITDITAMHIFTENL